MMLARQSFIRALFCVVLIVGVAVLATAVGFAAEQSQAAAALENAEIGKGLCVVLGLPAASRPEFVTELAAGRERMIYFQSADPEEVARVRAAADAVGLLGKQVFVDRGAWNTIHLADNLADAVLVGSVAQRAVPTDELLRVLHPGAVAFVGDKRIVKPAAKGTDDWTYPYHGPDNNPQSADRVARAPYLTQFIAEPKFCPSPAVTVAAGGRMFRVCGHLAHQANQNAMVNTLLAMNAYNGTILWKRPLREGFMILRNAIIATPDTLYLADDQSCKLLDAATGRLRDEITIAENGSSHAVWKWMALERGVLYGLVGDKEFPAPVERSESAGIGGWPRANWPGFDYQNPQTAWAQGRTFVAVRVKDKSILWRHQEEHVVDGRAVCLRGGHIYLLAPEKSLACLDVEAGKIVWRTSDPELLDAIGPLFPKQPRWTGLSPLPYAKCNDRYLFFSGTRIPRIVCVSTADGSVVWKKDVPLTDAGSMHLLLRDDGLYAIGQGTGGTSLRLRYETGEELRQFPGRRACTMATGSIDSIFYRTPGGTVRIDVNTGQAAHIAPMRPPCYEGVIVSNGLLYWGAWKCRCQLSLYGQIALAPAGDFDSHPVIDSSRLESGSGDSASVAPFPSDANDWPSYQGDNRRTSMTRVAIGSQVVRQWTCRLASAALPTAPVAAGGLVFVADATGAVRAIAADTGRLRWSAYTSGSVFFPPALWQGRLYAGSADGYVYAFEAATGRQLWRFQAAPVEQRIPVFGRIVSRWPVAGGVVVEDGVVYAAAGIAHYDGTYVYALDAVTGTVRWCNDTSGRLSAVTGSGISLQGPLDIDGGELRFAGGNACQLARYDLQTGQCISSPNDRLSSSFRTAFYPYYPEYGQYVSVNCALADGRLLNYAVDYSGARHSTLALFGPLPAGAQSPPANWRVLPHRPPVPTKRPVIWQHRPGPKYNGFIIGSEALVAAGQMPADRRHAAGQTDAFLAAFRIADGSPLWRESLPASVVKGGIAIDHRARLFVSITDGSVICLQ